MIVKEGSTWADHNDIQYMVIHVINQDGNQWVHYRNNSKTEPTEYSCYVESFLQRFTQVN